jgi:hypothetical protein
MHHPKLKILLLLLLFAATSPAIAQVRTVIVAKSHAPASNKELVVQQSGNKTCTLLYDLGTIPAGATILSCSPRFVLSQNVKPTSNFKLRIKDPATGKMLKDIVDITASSKVLLATSANLKNLLQAKLASGTFSIELSTPSVGGLLYMYSEDTAVSNLYGDYSVLPRLVVNYTVKNQPPPVWTGTNANAQNNKRTLTDIYGSKPVNNELLLEKKVFKNNYVPVSPSMYQDRLWFVYSEDQKDAICSLDPITQDMTVVRGDISAQPGFASAIDNGGRFYFINANTISYLDPADNTIKTAVSFGADNVPRTNLTIGRDGSLYFSALNNTYAYGPWPAFTKLWQYNYEEPGIRADGVSALALSNNNDLAYLVTVSNNNPNGKKIIQLNTLTGKPEKKITLDLQNAGTVTNPSPVPAPVIDNDGNVFLTNGYPTGNKLFSFDVSLTAKEPVQANDISQPLISNNGDVMYFSGTKLYALKYGGTPAVKQHIGAGGTIQRLAIAGNWVYATRQENGKNFVHILNPSEGLNGVTAATDTLYATILPGPDGSAYITTSTQIMAVRNRQFNTEGSNYSSERQNSTYRAGSLTVSKNMQLTQKQVLVGAQQVFFDNNVTVKKGALVTVESGGGIGFAPGFKVEPGAVLHCKNGY